jgi:sulfonate transport system permease protein
MSWSATAIDDRSENQAPDGQSFGHGLRGVAARAATPLVLVGLWELAARIGLIPPRTLAPPSEVIGTFWSLLVTGELGHHLLVSLGRVAAGMAIGVVTGVTLALLSGLSRRGEILIDAPMQMLRALPFLALVPLFILWFGIGEEPKIALVALGTTFPIYVNLFAGIRGIDAKLVEAASSFGLRRFGLIRHIVLPGALPSFLVGLRYALAIAWLSLVVAEQINASSGLGYLIMNARDFLRTDIIVVALIVYAFLGLGSDLLVRIIEQRALAWRPSFIRS